MKILLIRPHPGHGNDASLPPMGLGYLAGSLRRKGFDPEIWDLSLGRKTMREFEQRVARGVDAAVVGVQVYSRDVVHIRRFLDTLNPKLDAKTVLALGGPHPSVAPDHALEYFARADVAFIGEAETSFVQMALQLRERGSFSPEEIAGLAWRDGGVVCKNPQEFVQDLDALGHPAWDLIPPNRYHPESLSALAVRLPVAVLIAGRGCPFHCTFCSSRSIDGHIPRRHSVEHLLEDIRLFYNHYGVREIKLMDDNFTTNKRYVLDFCDAVSRLGYDLYFSIPCGVHVNTLDDEILDALKRIRIYNIAVALESGSQRIVDAMRKNIQLDHAITKIKHIAAKGIPVTCYFMIGYKDETVEDIKKTIRLSLSLPLIRAHFNAFCPFPGTEVFEELKREGRLSDVPWHLQHFEAVNYSFARGLDKRALTRWRIWALVRFYLLRPRNGVRLLAGVKSWYQISFIFEKTLDFFAIPRRNEVFVKVFRGARRKSRRLLGEAACPTEPRGNSRGFL